MYYLDRIPHAKGQLWGRKVAAHCKYADSLLWDVQNGHTKKMTGQHSQYLGRWVGVAPAYWWQLLSQCLPITLTTNQNINTVVYLSIWHLPNTVRDFACHPHRKQLNGLDVSPCCPIVCQVILSSSSMTHAKTAELIKNAVWGAESGGSRVSCIRWCRCPTGRANWTAL